LKIFKNKKAITILTIITGVVALISASLSFLVRVYVLYKFNVNLNEASSVGIIGISDGPTSIFVADITSYKPITGVFTLLTIIGGIYLISMRKLQK
jgi:Na+-transporting methylmalonyl-CoA/oxaloacetate decarboxylase beta subunit